MDQTFTDYLKEQFIETGEVNKENFEDLFPEWRYQLEDEEMDKYAEEWKAEEVKTWVELADTAISELQKIKGLLETPNQ